MSQSRRVLMAGFVVCVLLGVFFRLFHVDWKLYSYDETVTSLRASGYTLAEYKSFVRDGRTHSIGELERFQAPSQTTDEGAVWRSLALEDPQHPPLYFWATSLLERVTGDSILFRRLPAVLFALLTLPAMWWFAYELFGETLGVWCVTALVAVSPFHVEFAQDAREYSLWTLTIAVSSALLLRCLRGVRGRPMVLLWALYCASIAVGLWSFALFGLIVVAHALYVVLPLAGATPRRRVYAFIALLIGVASFGPWLLVIAHGTRVALADTAGTASIRLSAATYAAKWVFNAGTVFFDLDYVTLVLVPVAALFVALEVWSLYILVRTAAPRVWSFVLLLGAVPAASFVVPDIVQHQVRGIEARYQTPLWLALELATGYALMRLLTSSGTRAVLAGRIATAAVFSAGIVSCGVAAYARTWWIYGAQPTMPAIGAALAGEPHATLVYVSDDDILLELAPHLRPDLRFALHPQLDAAALQSAPAPFVIAQPAAVGRSAIAARLRLVPLPPLFPQSRDNMLVTLHQKGDAGKSAPSYQRDALYVGQ